jgi:hypothetical protein
MHTRKGTKNENHRWRDLHEFPIIIEKLHNEHSLGQQKATLVPRAAFCCR